MALDADRVFAASAESYARGIAAVREARKAARDPKTIARLDAEIATLERERGTLRRPGPGFPSISRNAALVSRRRGEIEAAGRDAVRAIRGFPGGGDRRGAFPGAAALVGTAEAIVALDAAGAAAVEPVRRDATAETPFDLASLTKPLCVGAICREAARSLPLDAPPGRFLPEWKKTRFEGHHPRAAADSRLGARRVVSALRPREGAAASGAPSRKWSPCRRPGKGAVQRSQLPPSDRDPRGALRPRSTRLFEELVARPARSGARFLPDSMPLAATKHSARFLPDSMPFAATKHSAPLPAATEKGDRFERAMTEARGLSYARFRDGVVCGEVHDGNAFRRGGVSGNAGLFGTAEDVWRLARRWLEPEAVGWAQAAPASSPRRGGWRGRAAAARVPRFRRCRRARSVTPASPAPRSGSTRAPPTAPASEPGASRSS